MRFARLAVITALVSSIVTICGCGVTGDETATAMQLTNIIATILGRV